VENQKAVLRDDHRVVGRRPKIDESLGGCFEAQEMCWTVEKAASFQAEGMVVDRMVVEVMGRRAPALSAGAWSVAVVACWRAKE
jgi:hypothetical protein